MARLQILELPEGANDERPPFVLVVDQMPADDAAFDQLRTDLSSDVATRIGARAVLAFEGSIEIPANDTTAYAQQVAEEVGFTLGKVTRAVSSQHLADERTDIARDMDRLASHKDKLLDALGMDPTRDWDDIRNAAAGIRKQRDAQAEALEQLRAGEEPGWRPDVVPTPGQWIARWNQVTPEKRLSMAAQIVEGMPRANDCLMLNHAAELAELRAEVARLRAKPTDA